MTTAKTATKRSTRNSGAAKNPKVEGLVGLGPNDIPQEVAEPRRRSKRQVEEVQIPAHLLNNPERMNFALLLALLNKSKGVAAFTAADFDFEESDFNIMFAKSLQGDKLEVRIVSVQSGMLKAAPSPSERDQWTQQTHQHLPEMPQYVEAEGLQRLPRREDMLATLVGEESPQDRFLKAAAQPPQETQQAEPKKVVEFPFQVGDTPQTSSPVDLGQYVQTERKLSQIDQETAQAEERVLKDL